MNQSCKKHKHFYYVDTNGSNANNAARRRIFDVEIPDAFEKARKISLKPLLNQIFCFSVISFLILLTGYIFIVHKLVYYEVLESVHTKTKMDYIVKMTEEISNKIQLLERDLQKLKKRNVLTVRKKELPFLDGKAVEYQIFSPRLKRSLVETNSRDWIQQPITLGIAAIQFRGVEGDSKNVEGLLGPWLEDTQTGHNKETMGLKLTDNDRKVVVSRKGMYLIYSQVTYMSENSTNGYSINVMSKMNDTSTSPPERQISVCTGSTGFFYKEYWSCHTSIVQLLDPDDTLYLRQSDNRRILFKRFLTYFGVMLVKTL